MRNLLLALGCLGIALAGVSSLAGRAAAGLPDLEDPKVQYEVGMSHLTGQGAKKDPVEAVAWLRKAALRGHAEAQAQLGICYQNGFGVERDLVQALSWFQRAAEQGSARGQLQLGQAYRHGRGVEPDLLRALAYIRKAAENGHPKAQMELGIAYRDGFGVKQDPEQAAFWLALAAGKNLAARMMFAGVRNKLSAEQRAQLDERLEAWKRDHPAPAGPSASSGS
jgi:hypothetical protein